MTNNIMTGATGRVVVKPTRPAGWLSRYRQVSCGDTAKDWQFAGFPAVAKAGTGGMYRPGDRVVYTASKHSRHPGPRAEQVTPERHGEGYFYDVRKYWLVRDVQSDGTLTVVTRRGKERRVSAADDRLRPARWWESLFFGSRFPSNSPRRDELDSTPGVPAGT